MSILWTKNCELICCSLLKIYVWPSFLLRFSSLATVEESISNILSTYPYQVLSVKSLHQIFVYWETIVNIAISELRLVSNERSGLIL